MRLSHRHTHKCGMMLPMTVDTNEQTQAANAGETAAYWQRINAALDMKITLLGADMQHYLAEDLSERLPRAQPIFYRHGTACPHDAFKTPLSALETRLQQAMQGNPNPQDEQAFKRASAPLYAAFLRAEYPENKQQALAVLKHQMAQAASAYAAYSERTLYDSFPRELDVPSTKSTRELQAAITQPLLRAYCCMEMLRPSTGEHAMGLTDNRMAIMEAFDFMRDAASTATRAMLEQAPKIAPKTQNDSPSSRINGSGNIFLKPAAQPRTREQILRDLGKTPTGGRS